MPKHNMSKEIEKIKSKAEQLATVRKEINELKEGYQKVLEAKEYVRDTLQADLITQFEKEGLSSIKTRDGDTYSRSVRKGVEITNEIRAFDWALKNRAVSISKILVAQKLKEETEMPEGFKLVETPFISVRSAKKKNGED